MTIIPALEPLAHWDPSGAAFPLTTVRLLRESEGGEFLIIPAAMGGSGFADHMWTADTGPLYKDLVARVQFVLDRYPSSTIRAVLWHGGETEWVESEDGYNQRYPEQMAAMVDRLRADIPIRDAPFVMGGLAPEWANQQNPHPNEILPMVAELVDACFVPSDGLSSLDGIHFDLRSQKILGQRYFDALQNC